MPERKLRVAVVTTHPPGIGTLNEYGYHFVRFLRQKHEVRDVVLLADLLPDGQHYASQSVDGEAPLLAVSCWRFSDPLNCLRILAAVRRARPDIVIFNLQFASFGSGKIPAVLGLLAPVLVKVSGIPTIVLMHNIMETVDLKSAGFAVNPITERLIRLAGNVTTRLLLRADLVALTIPKYVEILRDKYKARNVLLAPHGSFEEFQAPAFALPDGPLQIMTFGKFGTYKKIETLIEAFCILRERHGEASGGPALELVIAGTDSPNAQGYLERTRQQYARVPNIRFTGYVAEEDVQKLFTDAAVVVFPYTSTTGSSGVLHQAGNYGKAVVLPNLGDLAELVTEEGYTGIFFEPSDPASLAEAIDTLIVDADRRNAIGSRNYLAARGLPISEVVDWYLLHAQGLLVNTR